jgi:hypothetical protein
VRRSNWKRGKYRARAIIVKEVENIKIVFYDSKSIYVKSADGVWVVFHRWFAPKGSYQGGWKQFRHLLLYEKRVDFAHCHRLAFRYDIPSQVSRAPDLDGKTVEIITNINQLQEVKHEA